MTLLLVLCSTQMFASSTDEPNLFLDMLLDRPEQLMLEPLVRRLLTQQLDALFETYDLLLAPATPFPALVLGTETAELNGETIPARSAAGIMTQPLTPAGVPIAVAPLWPEAGQGLPVGVQLIARPWREADALAAAFMLEQAGVPKAPIADL